MRRARPLLFLLLPAALLFLVQCSGNPPEATTNNAPSSAPTPPVSIDKNAYPVFSDPDSGADPAVPPEAGGKGFKGEGWETNTNFDLIGDPRAVKGGAIRDSMLSFFGTLRMAGPEWNSVYNYTVGNMIYEELLLTHPTTLEYIPLLATHWKIEPDKMTFRFRVNPNARFSDGTPVTSEDVVASWKFYTDKSLDDLYYNTMYGYLEMPVAESKYIVKFKSKTLGWENFHIASRMRIFPAHALKDITGKTYLRDFNFKLLPGSGPYILEEKDIQKGNSVTLRRRKDYWAEKDRRNVGVNNVDEYQMNVVRDDNLALEKLKKGELDYFAIIARPQVWAEQLNDAKFQRGLLVKRAVYNYYPADLTYIGFNTRRKPWDDIRVRKAFALLLNREQMIDKLFYQQYKPVNSFFPATIYENPNNPKNLYNPQEALKLLAEAGWSTRDAQGRLTRNGQPFLAEIMYSNKAHEQYLTVYQADLQRAGITANLRFVTFETSFKMNMQRQFDISVGAWGVGNIFPEPRPEYHSEGADRPNTNNITGFKNPKIDALCAKYDAEFDPKERVKILQELDNVLTNEYHYVLRWYDPAQRIAYVNKYGMPAGTFSRVGSYDGSFFFGISQLWWVDPEKTRKLEDAMRDSSIKLEVPPVEDHYWQERPTN